MDTDGEGFWKMTYEQFYATYYNPENTEQTVYTEEV